MGLFLVLGIAGIVLLACSLLFDGVLEGFLDGWLSLPVIAGFVSMLGFTGAIVSGTTGLGMVPATAAGALAGVAAGWLTWKLSRALMDDRTSAAPRGDDLIGTSGSVVTAIPADGYGEVLLRVAGQPVKYAAKSAAPLRRGAEVWVEEALSPSSVRVRPVER
ncbi:hypothetical protein [Streptomyces gobitricini]